MLYTTKLYYRFSNTSEDYESVDIVINKGFPTTIIDYDAKVIDSEVSPKFLEPESAFLPIIPTEESDTANVLSKILKQYNDFLVEGGKEKVNWIPFYATNNIVTETPNMVLYGIKRKSSGVYYLMNAKDGTFDPDGNNAYGFAFYFLDDSYENIGSTTINGRSWYNIVSVSYDLNSGKIYSYQLFPAGNVSWTSSIYSGLTLTLFSFFTALTRNFKKNNDITPTQSNNISKTEFSEDTTAPTFFEGSLNTGFFSIITPTENQLKRLSDELWSENVFDLIAKWSLNPLDYLINFYRLPFGVATKSTSLLSWGNVVFQQQIQVNEPKSQYITQNMGGINITEKWHNILDYDPYTKVTLYIPFSGYHQLSTDEVMNSQISLSYNVDLLTGSAIAQVSVNKNVDGTNMNSVMYQFSCDMAAPLPITSTSNQKLENIKNAITAIGSVASMATSGGVGSAGVMAGITSAQAGGEASAAIGTIKNYGSLAMSAMNTIGTKTLVNRSGALGANNGFVSVLIPYVIIERPIMSIPKYYPKFNGYPLNVTKVLSELKGYTEIMDIHLDGVIATQEEKDELESLLKGGVIL